MTDSRNAPRHNGQLDEGRCCGRKPILYKLNNFTREPDPHHFCTTCHAEYSTTGKQRPNFAWKRVGESEVLYCVRAAREHAFELLVAAKFVEAAYRDPKRVESLCDEGWSKVRVAIAKAEGRE